MFQMALSGHSHSVIGCCRGFRRVSLLGDLTLTAKDGRTRTQQWETGGRQPLIWDWATSAFVQFPVICLVKIEQKKIIDYFERLSENSTDKSRIKEVSLSYLAVICHGLNLLYP